MHDVLRSGEFTEERIAKIDKVFVKSKAHRILFPNIPDEKISIIPNGIKPEEFNEKVERNPYLIINTSSPDRHFDATLDVFEELIRRQPNKPWKLAWYYGWGLYDAVHKDTPEMLEWKRVQMERFEKLKKEGRAEGGTMIGHKDIAKKYLEAGIFLYPSQFYEIDCISARKAQLAGCKCVTSDFAALNETVLTQKIHTEGEKWEKENTFGDNENRDKYVDAIIEWENKSNPELIAEKYNWGKIAFLWDKELN
jgi:glycosyltransferase involved in cell wall biosynthesis